MFFRGKTPLKRFMVRLGFLGAAGVLGFIAIAQAQRGGDTTTDAIATEPAANLTGQPDGTVDAAGLVTSPPFQDGMSAPPQFGDVSPTGHGVQGDYVPPVNSPVGAVPASATAPIENRSTAGQPDPFGLAANTPSSTADRADDRYGELYNNVDDRYAVAATSPPANHDAALTAASSNPDTGQPALRDRAPEFRAATDGAPPSQPIRDSFADAAQPAPLDMAPSNPPFAANDSPFAAQQPDTSRRFDEPAIHPVDTSTSEPARFEDTRIANDQLPTSEGQGRPGGRHLEGPQSPKLMLKKEAPAEIQVGTPATFRITVENAGSAVAHDVKIHDAVPNGATLVSTKPEARAGADGALVWLLGTLEPKERREVELAIVPQREGEIGSIASVTFRTDASVRTTVTKPELTLEIGGPHRVMIGEPIDLTVRITNVGSGVAGKVLMFDALPPELKHASGPEVEYDVGDLQPSESREIQLNLTAAQQGRVINVVSAKAEGQVQTESSTEIEIIAPGLQISMEGPRRRYLERKATYTLTVANPGTAPAREVELVSHLPKGIQFVSANNRGRYDGNEHAVHWSLAELPEGETGTVELVTLPVEAGQHKIRLEGRANRDLSDRREEIIVVEGLAAIFFEVADAEDPIEVGGETEYEIRILNQGTKTAENVRVAALVPPGMEAMSADGPTRHQIEGGQIFFEGLERLAPKADATYRVRVRGQRPGDQRLRVQVQCDEMDSPVTKEESTRVYADE